MTLSKRTRFEVLKRDNFTCAYCGRAAPDVVLHVDHIVARANGGTDDLVNLLTACVDCNQGKAAKPLSDVQVVDVASLSVKVADAWRQLDLVKEHERAKEAALGELETAWSGRFQPPATATFWPSRRMLLKFNDLLGAGSVVDAMDITRAKFDYVSESVVHYFYGVCWRINADKERASADHNIWPSVPGPSRKGVPLSVAAIMSAWKAEE